MIILSLKSKGFSEYLSEGYCLNIKKSFTEGLKVKDVYSLIVIWLNHDTEYPINYAFYALSL